MQELHVDLGDRSYPIYIGSGVLTQPELLQQQLRGDQVMVVTNETIAPLYLDQVRTLLKGCRVHTTVLPDGEAHKNLTVLNQIFDRLLQARHTRKTTLVALGGGVVGDMTGFAAACYQRGVDFMQIPTTVLSQVDSSVGGKTGVNHALGKNMIGAFHQPRCVLIDTDTLATLPDRELSAGIAEVIKYGLICDRPFYDWLREHAAQLLARDTATLTEAIYRSCAAKARVVAADEREAGLRAILNLGHTFGHAIETAQGYGQWLHGEAVAAGMVLAADLSRRMGWITETDVATLRQLLSDCQLPVAPPAEMTVRQFLDLMAVDKKVIDGRLRLVLLRAIGEATITTEAPQDCLEQCLIAAGASP